MSFFNKWQPIWWGANSLPGTIQGLTRTSLNSRTVFMGFSQNELQSPLLHIRLANSLRGGGWQLQPRSTCPWLWMSEKNSCSISTWFFSHTTHKVAFPFCPLVKPCLHSNRFNRQQLAQPDHRPPCPQPATSVPALLTRNEMSRRNEQNKTQKNM